MHEIVINCTDKAGKYEQVIPQIVSLIETETNEVANYANIAAKWATLTISYQQ